MGSPDGNDKLPKHEVNDPKSFPIIFVDQTADFAAVRIKPGIEAKSYVKDGIVFSEDENGNIIEIQILNVSLFNTQKTA